jgi:hypothetical protein
MNKTSPPQLRKPKAVAIDMSKSCVSMATWGDQAQEDLTVIDARPRSGLRDKISQEILGGASLRKPGDRVR